MNEDLDFKDDSIEDRVKESLWSDRKLIAFIGLFGVFMMIILFSILSFFVPLESFKVLIELGVWVSLGLVSLPGVYMGLKSYFDKQGQQ